MSTDSESDDSTDYPWASSQASSKRPRSPDVDDLSDGQIVDGVLSLLQEKVRPLVRALIDRCLCSTSR